MSDNDEIARTITWSSDTRIAVIFAKAYAAQAGELTIKTDLKSPLCLRVNLPKAALFHSVGECTQFFDED